MARTCYVEIKDSNNVKVKTYMVDLGSTIDLSEICNDLKAIGYNRIIGFSTELNSSSITYNIDDIITVTNTDMTFYIVQSPPTWKDVIEECVDAYKTASGADSIELGQIAPSIKKLKNSNKVHFSSTAPTSSDGDNGDLWIGSSVIYRKENGVWIDATQDLKNKAVGFGQTDSFEFTVGDISYIAKKNAIWRQLIEEGSLKDTNFNIDSNGVVLYGSGANAYAICFTTKEIYVTADMRVFPLLYRLVKPNWNGGEN